MALATQTKTRFEVVPLSRHIGAELLKRCDVPHAGGSDASVILQGYRRWGEDVVHQIKGIYALLIWDQSREILLGLRNLEQLNLYHTVVTNKAHDELKSGLAKCRIIWDEKSAMPNRRRS